MDILTRLHKLKEEYERKHESEPELLFINFKIWEEIANHPSSTNGVPQLFGGCEVVPANEMKEDILFCNRDDLRKALESYNGSTYPVSIKKLTVSERREATHASRIAPELTYQYFQIPSEAIKAYQRNEEHKNLKF